MATRLELPKVEKDSGATSGESGVSSMKSDCGGEFDSSVFVLPTKVCNQLRSKLGLKNLGDYTPVHVPHGVEAGLNTAAYLATCCLPAVSSPPLAPSDSQQIVPPRSPILTRPSTVSQSLFLTVDPAATVEMQISIQDDPSGEQPETVPAMFKRIMEKNKHLPALAMRILDTEESKETGEGDELSLCEIKSRLMQGKKFLWEEQPKKEQWKIWDYDEYYGDCILAAKGFIQCGLEVHHSVCILGFNTPSWHIANMAAIMAGGISVGLHQDCPPERCMEIFQQNPTDIIVVGDEVQIDKILKLSKELPDLKAIVNFHGLDRNYPADISHYSKISLDLWRMEQQDIDTFSHIQWNNLLSRGLCSLDDEQTLEERMANMQPNSCCTVVYSEMPGTLGLPKGVMLSHDNITWSCKRFVEAAKCKPGQEAVVSYLPLANITSQILDIYAMIACAGSCWFAQPDALQGSLLQTLAEVRPTLFLGLPKVWESIREYLEFTDNTAMTEEHLKELIEVQKYMFREKLTEYKLNQESIDHIFLTTIKRSIGLDRCYLPMSGFAPVSRSTRNRLWKSFELRLCALYQKDEATGPIIISNNKYVVPVCGKPSIGTEICFLEENDNDDQCVEVSIKGRQVFMGYLRDIVATDKVCSKIGHVKTGDSGFQTDDGIIAITGSVKDMIVLKSGLKLPPLPFEEAVLKELPIANQAVLIGDGHEFPVCVVTLKMKFNQECNEYTPYLDPLVCETLSKYGCNAVCLRDIFDNEENNHALRSFVEDAIDRLKVPLSRISVLSKYELVPDVEHAKKREFIIKQCGSAFHKVYGDELLDLTEAIKILHPL